MVGMLSDLRSSFAARGFRPFTLPVVQAVPETDLIERVPGFDGWIMGDDPATANVFEAGRRGRLRAAIKWGVGVDNVDFEAATRLGIPVGHTPGMFGEEVADVAMGYIIGLARETYGIDRGVRAGAWPKPRGISLREKTVALVGFGDVGRSIARRLLAANMRVIAYDPGFAPVTGLIVEHRAWPDGFERADFLVLCCALTLDNVHMIDRSVLAAAKPGLRVVNVARGKLIDEAALSEGLDCGCVHSAALDVFEEEPLPQDSPLRAHAKCVFGSHNGSNTVEAVLRASERAIEILHGYLQAAR
jgi:D-3-phosphoglycerate dehydrogenase